MQKADRWYEIKEDRLHVYGGPIPDKAPFVSVVAVGDLPYYRAKPK